MIDSPERVPASAANTPTYVPPKRAANRNPHRHQAGGGIGNLLATVIVLLVAPVVALVMTTYVFQSYEVDGSSMETTLSNKDRLLIWKVPKTLSRLTQHPYTPNRGDIIVFSENLLSSYGQVTGKQLVKRVIGLPGEHVIVKNGTVTVYNSEQPEGFEPDKTLPYGDVITATTSGNVDIIVPVDSVFVLGDNRSNSLDSRTFGPVPDKNVVGKLAVRVWPAQKMQLF